MKLRRVLVAICKFVLPLLAGVALTLLLVPLWAGWVTAPVVAWWEAVGTWVGGLATVGALLWAVMTFRRDINLREREEEQRTKERIAAELARATRVRAEVRTGGTQGAEGGGWTMTSVQLGVSNDDPSMSIDVTGIQLDLPFVVRAQPPRHQRRILPGDSMEWSLGVDEDNLMPPGLEPSGKSVVGALVEYKIDGETWTRHTTDGSDPTKCALADHPAAQALPSTT